MLNTYAILNPDWKNPQIPGQSIQHNSITKSIKDREKVEKYEFLVITT